MTHTTTLKTRIRTLALGLAATAVAVTSLAGMAGTASAAGKAPTKVLIEAESGGFFGYVQSPKAQKCANGRTVYVYQQLGSKPRPATDTRVAMDTAQANNDGYQWNIGNPGLHEGRFYAHVNATPQCKGANSITLMAQE
jgi:tRNA A37 threonylcarbamoyladenosine modification protein TsaB